MKYYDEWSKNNKYNKDMFEWEYSGPKETSETLLKYQNNKDIKNFKSACDGMAMEMADDGYDLYDVQEFMKEYAKMCATDGYKKAVR